MTQSVSLRQDKRAPATPTPAAEPAPKGVSIVGLVAVVLLVAGAATGATLYVTRRGHHADTHHAEAAHPAEHAPAVVAPGYTLPLEPFLVMASDANNAFHAMRVTLAVEFDAHVTEETVRPFVPRIRDAALAQLRATTYENAANPAQMDHLRGELQTRFQSTGVPRIVRVLITDLVVQ